MKNEHTEAWAHDLITTTRKQVEGVLGKRIAIDAIGNCCLGIGCETAGIERDYPEDGSHSFSYLGADTLPPRQFAQWLGFDMDVVSEDVRQVGGLCIDWPDETYRVRCYVEAENHALGIHLKVSAHDHELHECSPWIEQDGASSEFAAINDGHTLTFPQIGDMIRYFGVQLRYDSGATNGQEVQR